MVKVAYRGYFDDGATFIDQTRQPIEFPCADGWMPPAFVDAVRDMAVGETKRVRVGADEAYEKRTEERVIEVERGKIPANIKPVSYTHLDVYKRQPPAWRAAPWRPAWPACGRGSWRRA